MRLLSFYFNKISAEKKNSKAQNLKVDSNVDIKEIKEAELEVFKSKSDIVEVSFHYELNYSEDFAKIEFDGTLILSLDKKESKEILKSWQNKELSPENRLNIINYIIRRTSIKALQLEEEMGIPFHFPLPRVSKKSE